MIDYTPLDVKVPRRKTSDLTNIPLFGNLAGAIVLSVILTAIIPVHSYGKVLVFLALLPLMWYTVSNSGYSATRLSNFAVANGFHYIYTKSGVTLKGVMGGDSPEVSVSSYITGSYKDFNFEIFDPYSRGFYIVMQVQLRNKYPHIVLDNHTNNSLVTGSITRFFGDREVISLEGDFDQHFKMYSKVTPEDSLRIMTPDVMQLVIDFSHDYDIELYEDSLDIIGNYKFANGSDIKELFDLADKLLDKLDRRAATVQADFDSSTHLS